MIISDYDIKEYFNQFFGINNTEIKSIMPGKMDINLYVDTLIYLLNTRDIKEKVSNLALQLPLTINCKINIIMEDREIYEI